MSLPVTRGLVDIDSTTGREGDCVLWMATLLSEAGYGVVEQVVDGPRRNIYAAFGKADVVLSTHLDCVPPFFPSHLEGDMLFGRGSCDAKGIAACQVAAVENAAAAGHHERRAAVRRRRRAGQRRREDRAGAGVGLEVSHQRRADRQPARHRHARRAAVQPARERACGALVVSRARRVGDRKAASTRW